LLHGGKRHAGQPDGGSGQLFVSHYKRGDKYEPFDHALDAEHGMLIRTVIEERRASLLSPRPRDPAL
jgi:hypothetical protein